MKSELIKTDKFNFITFDNIFTDEELDKIWLEAKFLCDPNKLKAPGEQVGSAKTKDDISKKKGLSIFLEAVYRDRSISNYLTLYKKFTEEIIKKNYLKEDYTLSLFFNTNRDNTLMNYFVESDYYEAHSDQSCYTYIFWLFEEPKSFEGGDLYFPAIGCNINIASNCGILFPGWAEHEVTKIKTFNSRSKWGGRFSFNTFFFHDNTSVPS